VPTNGHYSRTQGIARPPVQGVRAIHDSLRTALPAVALSLGLIWAGTSLPGAAAAQARDQAGSAEPASETVDQASSAEPASETMDRAGSAEPASASVDQAGNAEPASATVDQAGRAGPETVVQFADWAIASGNNDGLPFVIIDKVAAEVFVFGAHGQLRGAAPALLGFARGDNSTPGVGDRELSHIRPADRTTPAGRFVAGFGPAFGGKKVLWVDYATAISLHPVIVGNPKEHRKQRLQSPTPKDNRITFGCINVPAAFYNHVVRPTFKATNGVVYILPEMTPLNEVFPSFQAQHEVAATRPDHVSSAPASSGGLGPQ